MFSLYLSRQKQEEALRAERAQQLQRAIHSEPHRRITDTLNANYHARVEEWMHKTMQAPVPTLHPKPISQADIDAAPHKFYRAATLGGPNGFRSTRGGDDAAAVHELPEHLQMSARKFQTERERLAAYERSDDHAALTGRAPYSDPLQYDLRMRQKSAELAGPIVFKPQTERQRIEEAITARDVGGRAFPYEEPPSHGAIFRAEEKDKWRAGHFSARLPSLPIFSKEERVAEPYAPPVPVDRVFRHIDPNANIAGQRFTTQVPTDRFVSLPPGSARALNKPVSDIRGTHTLGAGLNSSGIYGPEFELDLSRVPGHAGAASASARTQRSGRRRGQQQQQQQPQSLPPDAAPVARTYWRTVATLAHTPGSQSTPGAHRDDTAQQLFKTYRRHLAY